MRVKTLLSVAGIVAFAILPGTPAWTLSLEEALIRAVDSRFEITAIPGELLAAEGRVLQSAVRPGLEMDLESRNVFEEISVGMSLVQERGGKREARIAAARADRGLLGTQAEVRRLDIGQQVRKAFAGVLAAEAALALTEEALALARSFSETVAEKVRAGTASPIEETRASVRLHGATAEVERARREVALARAELVRAVGDPGVRSEPIEGHLPEEPALPDDATTEGKGLVSADLGIFEKEVAVRRSVLEEQRAQSASDLTWRVAANRSRPDDETWLTVGVSIPLPSGARKRGALAVAAAEVDRAELERATAERRIAGELQRTLSVLEAFAREAAILKSNVLDGAERVLATVEEGYRLGKFPYLDVLDAAQVLLEARLQHTAALAAAAQARIDVDRLLGRTALPTTSSTR